MRPTLARALRLVPVGAGALLVLAGIQPTATHAAAADVSITVPTSPGSTSVTYQGHAPFNNDSYNIALGLFGLPDPKDACNVDNHSLNDQHTISVTVPPASGVDTFVNFTIRWTPLVGEPVGDLALLVYGPDKHFVDASDGSQTVESVTVNAPKPGVYTAMVCSFQVPPQGQDYTGTVTASAIKPGTFPEAPGVTAPSYHQFESPAGTSENANEPSIGNSWKTGATFFTSTTDVYKVAFDDKAGTSTWKIVNDKAADPSNKISLDPIGFTDSVTGRTFVSQLLFATSGAVFTDDDFATITPSEGGGTGINGFDHQTFASGPYPVGMHGTGSYPHAVYYCSQARGLYLGGATCARSDDGGVTFGQPVLTYDTECSGIHGHLRIAPDGTLYLPNSACGNLQQGVIVSTDAGKTWKLSVIPDSHLGQSDPSVAAGSDGTVYFGYADGTGKPRIAVSRDRGQTWSKSIDVGLPKGIRNTEFSDVIAGDGDRAAFAFLGTTTPGSDQTDTFGKSSDGLRYTGGEWHLYIATTYDRGIHWTLVDATPKDPVQRGCIWNHGGSNPCRNLADFNDITIDKEGRVMVGFADGCIKGTVTSGGLISQATGNVKSLTLDCPGSTLVAQNSLTAKQGIVRQQTGKTLFARYDGLLPGSTTPAKRPTKKPTKQPTKTPTKTPSVTPPSGGLAATGMSTTLPILGGLLIALGLGLTPLSRRVRRRPSA